jgi:hypothetical protein
VFKPVVVDWAEKRRQPVGADFTVGVQEDDDLTPRLLRSSHPCSDKTLALCIADQSHFAVELEDVVLQFALQVFCIKSGLENFDINCQ